MGDTPKGTEDVELQRAHAVALLVKLYESRQLQKVGRDNEVTPAKLANEYLEANPVEQLWDGEHRIRAWHEFSKGSKTLAVQSLPLPLLRDAAARGLLVIDLGVWKTLERVDPGLYLDLQPFIGSGAGKRALKCTKED